MGTVLGKLRACRRTLARASYNISSTVLSITLIKQLPSNNTTDSLSPSEITRTTANLAPSAREEPKMAEQELASLLKQLHQILNSHNNANSGTLLSRAKVALLHLNALIPTSQTKPAHLRIAREILELGALISIRQKDPESFTRYFQQLQPFYSLPSSQLSKEGSNSSKITGLYLLLLLSQGNYAEFHTSLEALEVAAQQAGGKGLEDDAFIQYPIRLERALMEGSYDKVWGETKGEAVPSKEFEVFSEVRGVIFSLSLLASTNLLDYRFSSAPSGQKSLLALRRPILRFPYRTPRTFSFLRAKAA